MHKARSLSRFEAPLMPSIYEKRDCLNEFLLRKFIFCCFFVILAHLVRFPLTGRITVPVKSKLQHPPPGNPPGHLNFLENFFGKFPPPRAKKLFKCPAIRSISSDQIAPPPGKLVDYLIIQNKESQVSLAHG